MVTNVHYDSKLRLLQIFLLKKYFALKSILSLLAAVGLTCTSELHEYTSGLVLNYNYQCNGQLSCFNIKTGFPEPCFTGTNCFYTKCIVVVLVVVVTVVETAKKRLYSIALPFLSYSAKPPEKSQKRSFPWPAQFQCIT